MTGVKLVIRVYFVDDSFRTLAVLSDITAKELCQTVASKINLENTQTFALFYNKNGEERCLEDDEQPCKVMVQELHGINADMSQYTERAEWEKLKKEWGRMCKFVYKRRVFLRNKAFPREDPTFIRYSYIQAVSEVISGNYPCDHDDAVTLAGLQMQVTFGDHNKQNHVAGFLKDKIGRFIPEPLLKENRRLDDWEKDVFAEHARLAGLQTQDAMLSYLNHVRNWPFYGSTFWTVQTVNKETNSLPEQVVLAVNSNGIQLLKPGSKEQILAQRFSDIYSWAYKRNAFAFVSGALSKQKFQFATVHGKDIARTLQAYVDILLEEYKSQKEKKQ
eukprot:gb/GECH01013371.1/.p1 GENE.gb/GECH01013371.1/~~gb/GECH01013371.1/.p1  ORF type:complete len:332 (+),score=63.07 gb/GECH01013371.1/:1-996(+)